MRQQSLRKVLTQGVRFSAYKEHHQGSARAWLPCKLISNFEKKRYYLLREKYKWIVNSNCGLGKFNKGLKWKVPRANTMFPIIFRGREERRHLVTHGKWHIIQKWAVRIISDTFLHLWDTSLNDIWVQIRTLQNSYKHEYFPPYSY